MSNQLNIIAHVIISVALLLFCGAIFLFSKDLPIQAIATGIVPLILGYWIPSPVQQGTVLPPQGSRGPAPVTPAQPSNPQI